MSLVLWLATACAVVVLVYLGVVLFHPERF